MSPPLLFLEQERRVHPAVVDLARALSLATWIDPALVRAMRLELAPYGDPGIESDLWFSPLVQVRSHHGLTLMPSAVEALREELTLERDRTTARRAWRVIARVHGIPAGNDGFTRAAVAPVLALEETLTYLAIVGTADALGRAEMLLGRALASVRDQQDRGVARWAVRTLPRLPEALRHSGAAMALAQAASARMGGIPVSGMLSTRDATGAWTPEMLALLGSASVGVRLTPEGLEISDPPASETPHLQVPDTAPLILDVRHPTPEGWQTIRSAVSRGSRAVVPGPHAPVLRVGTVTGTEHRLRAYFDGTVPGIWLIDRTRRGYETEALLRECVADLGWEVARFNEAIGSPASVVVWHFDSVDQLDPVSLVSPSDRAGFRDTLIVAGDRFVQVSGRSVDRELQESYDHARRTDDPADDDEGWLQALFYLARRLFDRPGEAQAVTSQNLRGALLQIASDRVTRWFRDQEARRAADTAADSRAAEGASAVLGREEVLAELDRMVSPEGPMESGVIVIAGSGGVGKSAIARAFVESRRDRAFVPQVEIQEHPDPGLLEQAVFQAVGGLMSASETTSGGAESAFERMREALDAFERQDPPPRHRPVLMLFDGLDGSDRNLNPFEALHAYIPSRLPRGVFVITTMRPASPDAVARLASAGRFPAGQLQVVDLDDERWRASAVLAIELFFRDFFTRAANWPEDFAPLLLAVGEPSPHFRRLLRCSDANFRVARMLGRWLENSTRRAQLPGGLEPGLRGVVSLVLEDLRTSPSDVRELASKAYRILSVARQPVPIIELVDPAPEHVSSGLMPRILAILSPLLQTRDPAFDRDVLDDRTAVIHAVDAVLASGSLEGLPAEDLSAATGHEDLLAGIETLLAHSVHASPSVQWAAAYRARYGLEHAVDGQLADRVRRFCTSWDFLAEMIATCGYDSALEQLDRVAAVLASTEGDPEPVQIAVQVVRDYGPALARDPNVLPGLAYNHLRRMGRSEEEIASRFGIEVDRVAVRLASGLGTSEQAGFFDGHSAAISALATAYQVSHEQARSPAVAVSGDRAGMLQAWDLEDGRLRWTLDHHRASVTAVAVQEWGFGPEVVRRGVSGDATGTLAVWDVATGKLELERRSHEAPVIACAISNDARWMLSVADDGSIFLGQFTRTHPGTLNLDPVAGGGISRPSVAPPCGAAFVERDIVLVWRDGYVYRGPIESPATLPGESPSLGLPAPVISCWIDRVSGKATVILADDEVAGLEPGAAVPLSPGHLVNAAGRARAASIVPLDDGDAIARESVIELVRREGGGVRLTLWGHRDAVQVLAREELDVAPAERANAQSQQRATVLVSGSDDCSVMIWNPGDGLPLRRMGTFGRPLPLIDVDRQEARAIFPSGPRTLAIHDLNVDSRLQEHEFDAPITACSFSSSMRWTPPPGLATDADAKLRVAVGLANGEVLIGDAAGSLDRFEAVQRLSSPVTSLEWILPPMSLVAVSDGGAVAVIPVRGPTRAQVVNTGHQIDAPAATTVSNDAFVACVVHGGELGYYRPDGLQSTLRVTGARISAMAASPLSGWLALGHVDGTVEVWRRDLEDFARPTRDRRGSEHIARLGQMVTCCGLAGDGSLLCGLASGRIVILDPASGEVRGEIAPHTRAVNGLTTLADSPAVVSWSLDGTLCVWDLRTRQIVGTTCSRAPFIAARAGTTGRIYAFDALGQVWVIATAGRQQVQA